MAREAKARVKIDRLLADSGWRHEDSRGERANVVHEKPTNWQTDGEEKRGSIDYLLSDENQFPLCVIEAKNEDIEPLTAKEQARAYAQAMNCPFVILSNGEKHYLWYLNYDEPKPITQFPTQQELQQKLVKPDLKPQAIAHGEIQPHYLGDKTKPLRDYQIAAINAVQQAAGGGKTRFLLEMATGTGKTTIAAALCKLFLNSGQVKRVLFLVDRIELENQAIKSLGQIFDQQRFVHTYKSGQWQQADIVVSTVQSLLAGNKYREDFSPADFGLVISDEAHRSLGGKSRAVFEYFDGYKLGLTATPKDYLKGTNAERLTQENPKEWEARNMRDTYRTFGCEGGEPTFRYDLMQGVDEGHLIKPHVLDARTNITTQLLSDEGYALNIPSDDEDETETAIYKAGDFEVMFFNDNTNRVLCDTILEHGKRDPITGEFGKTLVFCVRRHHAAVIAHLLNKCAHEKFGYTESNFAMQITSDVPNAQEYAKQFAANNLHGKSTYASEDHPDYDTSKTRICVTVGMMTTGYDCPDLLNVALLRPVFSPSDFVQMKGRGTRKFLFECEETGDKEKKDKFLLLDFFANYEYFEHEFDYDEKIELPQTPKSSGDDGGRGGSGVAEDPPTPPPAVRDPTPDYIVTETTIHIGKGGMKVDRNLPLHEQFERVVVESKAANEIVSEDDLNSMVSFVEAHVFSEENVRAHPDWTIMNIRRSYEREHKTDRKITLEEMVKKAFKKISAFPTRAERVEEEYDKFCDSCKKDIVIHSSAQALALRNFFETYLSDSDFREIIDSGQYARLADYSAFSIEQLEELGDLREKVVAYIREYLQAEIIELSWQDVA